MHSDNFTETELACPHCGQNNATPELLNVLEGLRAKLGQPLIVDSACRCVAHNAAVGGKRFSQHLVGRAADVRASGRTARELYALAMQIPGVMGLGVSDHGQYLHLDVRRAKCLVEWCYTEAGAVVPFYEV